MPHAHDAPAGPPTDPSQGHPSRDDLPSSSTASRSARTRARLQEAALGLFLERGFDAVTVAEVAAAAGVSHMTFFRHFPTKEDVVLDDPYDPLVAELVRRQPVDLAPLERVRRGLLAAWSAVPEPVDAQTRARVALVSRHTGLRARAWENNQRTEDVVVDALLASGTSRLEARVAAGACLGALMAALLDWGTDDDAGPLGARLVTALDLLAPTADGGSHPPAPGRPQSAGGRR